MMTLRFEHPPLRKPLRFVPSTVGGVLSGHLRQYVSSGDPVRSPCQFSLVLRIASEWLIFAYRLPDFIDRICCTKQRLPRSLGTAGRERSSRGVPRVLRACSRALSVCSAAQSGSPGARPIWSFSSAIAGSLTVF